MKRKKTFLSVVSCVVAFVMFFSLAACQTKKDPQITAIALDKTEATVNVGETVRLSITATYDNQTTDSLSSSAEGLIWSSSNESVATVAKGVVSGKAMGSATVTAKFGDYTATCDVTVHSLEVRISETSITIEKDSTKQLSAEIYLDGEKTDGEIEWSSNDETIATVDENGNVLGYGEGTTSIVAKRKGGSQSATCAVEVIWSKPADYNPIAWVEQNKLAQNTWGFWWAQDPSWANGTVIKYSEGGVYTSAYTESPANLKEGYEYIGMGKITFEYEVVTPGEIWGVQAFYRSTDNQEGGKLAYNHLYEVTFTVESNLAGKIGINPYNDIRDQGADESDEEYEAYLAALEAEGKYTPNNSEYEIKAGTQEVRVVFRHDDCGYIFQEGIYDNMGSAMHLQLAALTGGKAKVTVYNFQFKDLGAATYPVPDDESKHVGSSGSETLPTHPAAPEVKPASASTVTGVTLTVEGDKAIFNLAGQVDLAQFGNSVETAKTWLTATHFDLQQCGGSWASYAFERVNVTVNADGTFLIKYDITYLSVDNAGTGAYTSHFTEKETSEEGYADNHYRDVKLDEESAVPGASITVGGKKYTIVNVVGGSQQADNWGCVSIKVENV